MLKSCNVAIFVAHSQQSRNKIRAKLHKLFSDIIFDAVVQELNYKLFVQENFPFDLGFSRGGGLIFKKCSKFCRRFCLGKPN